MKSEQNWTKKSILGSLHPKAKYVKLIKQMSLTYVSITVGNSVIKLFRFRNGGF